ncbi:hypothetical protein CDD80_5161 [Ophiocordyceps camponoti-rufipedis]|uniref:Extracellular membrane protein CFEM domain-containing protein n=1 Tax=Ophiocordyceps camponoti-rufipedis TaxID=2004952 RepID=A0A2C5ZNT2_9HYPO|nr:hypothetical protein CDD80_5161 [Ophiocordyceps camponoti-rufipedis]
MKVLTILSLAASLALAAEMKTHARKKSGERKLDAVKLTQELHKLHECSQALTWKDLADTRCGDSNDDTQTITECICSNRRFISKVSAANKQKCLDKSPHKAQIVRAQGGDRGKDKKRDDMFEVLCKIKAEEEDDADEDDEEE